MAKERSLEKQFQQWTLVGSLVASGLPAAIYALQNSLLQISYKNLDSLTFSMLNQTKIFFTALFTYIILRYDSVSIESKVRLLLGLSNLILPSRWCVEKISAFVLRKEDLMDGYGDMHGVLFMAPSHH